MQQRNDAGAGAQNLPGECAVAQQTYVEGEHPPQTQERTHDQDRVSA